MSATPSAKSLPPISNSQRWLKRGFDIVVALAGLLALGPVFVVISIAVKCSDGGPVLFRQRRVGLNGVIFPILKFRTMIPNAERHGASVTKAGDPRITRVGRFLRKTKFDELPQLWNVLVGQMSFVGPRPEVPRYVERYTDEQREILRLKPGITDLATLEFRNEEELLRSASNVEEVYMAYCVPRKIELNRIYARRANLLSDIWLIIRTVLVCFESRPEGSENPPKMTRPLLARGGNPR